MRKEAAHGKLANRESAIKCARSRTPHESAARQEASPQIVRRPIRIATVPQTAKHATGIVAGPQPITASDEHAKPQTGATQAKRKPPDIVAHRAAQRRGGGFRYVRE